MNRIILDHLRRWGWLWLLLAICNGFATGAFLDEKRRFDGFTFQIVLWLGAMQLNFDLQRGVSRTLASLPLTARQIGRSWWIVSVLLPALLLLLTSALALMIHSYHTGKAIPLNLFIMHTTLNGLFLGAMFSLFAGELPRWPEGVMGWLRRILSIGIILGMMVINLYYDSPIGILLYLTATGLTVAGWFRAEQMVIQRATFRPGIQSGKHQPGQHKIAPGFGGLPYLWQTMALKIVYLVLVGFVWFAIVQFVMPGMGKMTPERFLSAIMPTFYSFGFFALFMFWLMPLMMQLRHLRTLPISNTTVSAMLTLIPSMLICLIGLGWSAATGSGFQVPIGFLAYAATFCLGAPLMVWQGLKTGMYAMVLMIMVGMSGAVFIKGTSALKLIIGLTSLAVIVAAFEITRRLLKSSSKAYRPLPANMNQWGAWR